MKKNQSNKTKLKSLSEDKRKADSFYNFGFDHITGKHIFLKCNNVNSHSFNCCNQESYYLGRIARTPKISASRSKWKSFYKYIAYRHTNFKKLPEYDYISNKYNIKLSDI